MFEWLTGSWKEKFEHAQMEIRELKQKLSDTLDMAQSWQDRYNDLLRDNRRLQSEVDSARAAHDAVVREKDQEIRSLKSNKTKYRKQKMAHKERSEYAKKCKAKIAEIQIKAQNEVIKLRQDFAVVLSERDALEKENEKLREENEKLRKDNAVLGDALREVKHEE